MADNDQPESIKFHYRRSADYRTIHADGMYGGVSPRGYIHISFFNERQPIPRVSERHLIGDRGGLATYGEEKPVETLDGIVRYIENTVFLDLRTAREFQEWLTLQIKALERGMAALSSQSQ